MRTIYYLSIAILGNALGTAIMSKTDLGMTAWGSAASNVAAVFGVSLGQAFGILSIIFYLLATIIRKKFILKEMIESAIFAVLFSSLSDLFIQTLPDLPVLPFTIVLLLNILGMLILMFGIAVHIRLHRFVHPMDIFLYVIQKKLKSVSLGTYLAYFIGFGIALSFGLINGDIVGIYIGTGVTLLSSGLVMKYYNKWILDKWHFEG